MAATATTSKELMEGGREVLPPKKSVEEIDHQ
jgi:hypothetical protein